MDIKYLKAKAMQIREEVLDYAYYIGKCHIGGSLSTIEILTALYYDVMKIDPQNPEFEDRDRFILSKGHGVLGLYAILADIGFFSKDYLYTYKKIGSILQGHPYALKTPGIEMSAGSLGQGISFGVGKALALKLKGLNSRVYVLVGDGELEEGQNWEAIASASHFKLDNLCVIVDNNGLQLDETVVSELSFDKLEDKFTAFGWDVKTIDGHDIKEIVESLKEKRNNQKPIAIIAKTVKGKGVSFMENEISWHCNKMTDEQYRIAKEELKKSRELMQ